MMTSDRIDLRNLDKSNWPTYRFDEIAQHISERVDPNNTDLKTYIGLEHIDSESLHIRRFGTPDDVNGTKLKFYKGDIIFGRRRAYQRKAGIATMDGFCSAHALVLRANPEVIDPQLFPFFMHSDLFMNRAVDISVGSLSPTINWGTLKHQEFHIPPKYLHANFAKLLWASDENLQKSEELSSKLSSIYQLDVDNFFSTPKKDWNPVPFNHVACINKDALNKKTSPTYKFHYLDIASIVRPKVIGDMKLITFEGAPSRARRIVSDNSIVLSMVRPYQKSFVFLEKANDVIASTGTAVVNAKKIDESRFLFHQFLSTKFLKFCENRMTGTSYPAITAKDVAGYKFSYPKKLSEINSITKELDAIELAIFQTEEKTIKSKALQKSITCQVF